MDTGNEKRNLVEIIIILILIVNTIILALSVFLKLSLMFVFINISIIFFIIDVVEPLNQYFKKRVIENKTNIVIIILKIVLLIIFIISSYKILLSSNYNLKYTYWVCLICFTLLTIPSVIETLKDNVSKRKIKVEKQNNILPIVSILFKVITLSIVVYFILRNNSYPPRGILLNDVKRPEYISVYKYHGDESEKASMDVNNKNIIDSFEDLNEIISELNLIQISNITSTDLLNYQRKLSHKDPYYRLVFSYKDMSFIDSKIEDGYIDTIAITPNGDIAIEVIKTNDNGILNGGFYKEVFPISLSQEGKEMLSKYLK